MKVKQIKEILDKFKKKYQMNMDYTKEQNNFKCQFKINSLLIATGQGSCKKYAKNDAAAKAYEILRNSDYKFAKKTGIIIPDDDYEANLKKYAEEKQIKLDFNILISNPVGYSKFEIKYDTKIFEGFGDIKKKKKCLQYICYNILNQIKNQQIVVNKIEQEIAPSKIKILIKQTQPKINEPIEIKNDDEQFQCSPYIAQFIEELKIQQFLTSIMIQDEVYKYFDNFISFMNSQNIFYFRPVGSLTTKSVRALKPEIDILVNIPKGNFPQFEQFLEKISKQFEGKFWRKQKHIRFELPFQQSNIFLRWTFSSLKANLYIKKKLTLDAFIHDEYMKQYQEEYLQNRYSTQYLSLIHQWREDSKLPLPIKILDYLIVQVSNLFQQLNPPIIVLKQVIYLLKVGILDEIIDHEKEEDEINPFLQSIPQNYIAYIKKLSEENRKQIKDISKTYDHKTIQKWISSYIN